MRAASVVRVVRPLGSRVTHACVALVLAMAAATSIACDDSPTSPSPAPSPGPALSTFIRFTSTPGDVVGRGRTILAEPGPFVFGGEMWSANNRLQVSANNPSNAGDFWRVIIAAPSGRTLVPGVYKDTRRIPPIGSANPTLDFAGDGRSCNLGTGEFEVLEAVYGPGFGGYSGSIERFRATFTQSCQESPADRITGEISLSGIQFGCKVSNNC